MCDIMDLLLSHMPQLHQSQREKLAQYYALLIEGNRRMNLTAITEPLDVVQKHFLDSLLAAAHIPHGAHCIDIGTGAGFPGIPLLIVRSDIKLCLLDSLNKRVSFLKETLMALQLHADCVHARAEDGARSPALRERFDIALSRAVAPLNVLLELMSPFVRIGGMAIAYKGKNAREEQENAANAQKLLSLTTTLLHCDTEYGARTLVLAKKHKPTDKIYPRKAGEPARKPL